MPEITVGITLSDANRADLPRGLRAPERLDEYAELYKQRVESPNLSFELQPEDWWTIPSNYPDQFVPRKTNRWWRAIHEQPKLLSLLTPPRAHIGVHQPIQNRDALSSNFFTKYEAIEETKQAMEFAQYIGADYFVFHLVQEDKWNWERRDQMEKALKVFSVFATYYTAQGMSFAPLIEILEYPKFPATGGEAFDLLLACRRVLPNTRISFDVTHLWSSRHRMVECGEWPDARVTFEASLEYAMEALANDIYMFQLGGGWESETNAIPGLHPQQDPFRFPIKLRESHGVYVESGEMDLNYVLEAIMNHSARRGRDLHLVLQVFDRDVEQILEGARLIRRDLVQRASQPLVEATRALGRRPRGGKDGKRPAATAKRTSAKKGAGKKATRARKK